MFNLRNNRRIKQFNCIYYDRMHSHSIALHLNFSAALRKLWFETEKNELNRINRLMLIIIIIDLVFYAHSQWVNVFRAEWTNYAKNHSCCAYVISHGISKIYKRARWIRQPLRSSNLSLRGMKGNLDLMANDCCYHLSGTV